MVRGVRTPFPVREIDTAGLEPATSPELSGRSTIELRVALSFERGIYSVPAPVESPGLPAIAKKPWGHRTPCEVSPATLRLRVLLR